ncbi:hypothetical protein [Arthrobacter sp. AL12]|nr:hypothetical protein [Arthrobacter sp. AL12]MDI3213620.1 hypothetical protein [Arthrobacter sp. AL12]
MLEAHRTAVEANLDEDQEYLRGVSAKIDVYRTQLVDNADG